MSEGNTVDEWNEMSRLRADHRRIFESLGTLREAQAAQLVINGQLSRDVEKLTNAVTMLNSTLDRSKGALWVISAGSGVLGGLITLMVTAILRRA